MNSIKKNIVWLFFANIIKGFYQWLVLILIIRYYTNYEVAEFTLAYAMISPFFMFANLQLKSIYIVDYNNPDKQINYFIIRGIMIAITVIVFMLYIYINNLSLIILVILLLKAIESLQDLIYGFFQKYEYMDKMSKSIIYINIFSLIIFFLSSYYYRNFIYSLFAVFIIYCIFFIFYDIKVSLYIFKKYFYVPQILDIKYIINILKNAIPLGLSVFITSYITNLPRIEVEHFLGHDKLAYFGAFSYMSIGLYQLLYPLQIIIRPKLAKDILNNNYILFKKRLMISIFVVIAFVIILFNIFFYFGTNIIQIIYSSDYIQYLNVLLLLLFAQGILTISGLMNIAIQANHIFKIQLLINIIVLISALAMSSFFIKNYGLLGGGMLVIFYSLISFMGNLYILIGRTNVFKN